MLERAVVIQREKVVLSESAMVMAMMMTKTARLYYHRRGSLRRFLPH
jgi:hypothetical protein